MAGLDRTDRQKVRKCCGCHDIESQRNGIGNQGHLKYVYGMSKESRERNPGEGRRLKSEPRKLGKKKEI